MTICEACRAASAAERCSCCERDLCAACMDRPTCASTFTGAHEEPPMMSFPLAREILSRVAFKDWTFYLAEENDRLWIQVRYLEADVDRDPSTLEIQHGRKWFVSRHATPSELVQTAFKAVATSMEHQAREHFTYRGARVFGPHFDVEQLVKLCHAGDHEDARR